MLGREDYLDAARDCAEFVLGSTARRRGPPAAHLQGRRRPPQRLPRGPRLPARGAADPLRSDLRAALVRRRRAALAETTIERFGDPERGGFFSTSSDHEELIARRKEIGDHPIPSGNSSAALGLLRLAALSGERAYEEQAEGVLRLFAAPAARHPDAFAHLLRALDFHLAPTKEVALVGDDLEPQPRRRVVRDRLPPPPRPRRRRRGNATSRPCSPDRAAVDGKPTAYVCENFACQAPVTRCRRAWPASSDKHAVLR